MAAQRGFKRKRRDSPLGGKSSISRASPKKTGRGRTLASQAQPGAHAETRQEHRTRRKTEQGETATETSSSKTKQNEGIKSQKDEALLTAFGEGGAEKRITFIVRVTVDEQGQAQSTEIEHAVREGKKRSFPNLDMDKLNAFMWTCISPLSEPELVRILPSHLHTQTLERTKLNLRLVVTGAIVSSLHNPGVDTSSLSPGEEFLVQARFRLEGRYAFAIAAEEIRYEMKVFVTEVSRGTSKRLTSVTANLVKDAVEYTPQAHSPGLSPGLYQLLTQVTILAPIFIAARFEGPTIQVAQKPMSIRNQM